MKFRFLLTTVLSWARAGAFAFSLAALFYLSAFAQTPSQDDPHAGHHMETDKEKPKEAAPAHDHSQMSGEHTMEGMDHSKMDHSQMNHGESGHEGMSGMNHDMQMNKAS